MFFSRNQFLQEIGILVALPETQNYFLKNFLRFVCFSFWQVYTVCIQKTHFPLVISPSKKHTGPPCDPSHVAAVFRLHQQQALVGTNGLPWHRHHQRIVFGAQDQSWTRDLPEHLEEVRGRFQRNPRDGGHRKNRQPRVDKGLIVGLGWLLVSLLRRFRRNNCFESRFKGAAWSSAEVFVSCSDIQYWKPPSNHRSSLKLRKGQETGSGSFCKK